MDLLKLKTVQCSAVLTEPVQIPVRRASCLTLKYISAHLCLATSATLCAAILVLLVLNIILGLDPFLIIIMLCLIFLLMTLITG